MSLWRDLEFRSHSHSFALRVWCEELGADHREWRGQLRDVTTGEVRYFRGWPDLLNCLEKMLNDDIEGASTRR